MFKFLINDVPENRWIREVQIIYYGCKLKLRCMSQVMNNY